MPGISVIYFVHLFFGSKGLLGMRGRNAVQKVVEAEDLHAGYFEYVL